MAPLCCNPLLLNIFKAQIRKADLGGRLLFVVIRSLLIRFQVRKPLSAVPPSPVATDRSLSWDMEKKADVTFSFASLAAPFQNHSHSSRILYLVNAFNSTRTIIKFSYHISIFLGFWWDCGIRRKED